MLYSTIGTRLVQEPRSFLPSAMFPPPIPKYADSYDRIANLNRNIPFTSVITPAAPALTGACDAPYGPRINVSVCHNFFPRIHLFLRVSLQHGAQVECVTRTTMVKNNELNVYCRLELFKNIRKYMANLLPGGRMGYCAKIELPSGKCFPCASEYTCKYAACKFLFNSPVIA